MRDALDLLTIMQKRFPTKGGKFHRLFVDATGALRLELFTSKTSMVFTLSNDDMRRSAEYISDTICERVLAFQTNTP